MKTLQIEQFNPTIPELTKIADKYKDLEIKGIEDVDGYNLVDKAIKELKKIKSGIKNTGKELRAEANAFRKAVIDKEKELIYIIEPTEKDLEYKKSVIEEEKEKAKRIELLPLRQFQLKEYNVVVDDNTLLELDDYGFINFLNIKKQEYLAEEQRKIEIEKEKMRREKELLEQKSKEVEIQKQQIVEEKEQIEVKKEKVEITDKYQKFLLKNGVNKENKHLFIMRNEENTVKLYKLVDTYRKH